MNISLLVFSRNDASNAISLAQSMRGKVDEIVIVDSSDREEHERLAKWCTGKAKLYFAAPLGYADLLRYYGISKCKSKWILYLDTDERLNERFLLELQSIVASAKCDAFAIRRYEEASEKNRGNFFTWQTRLFKKGKVAFTGIIHEQPVVHGRLCTLSDEYWIEHRTELMHHGSNTYNKMMAFEMLDYSTLNNVVLDYARKFFALDTSKASSKLIMGFVALILNAYELLGLKKKGRELSKTDYLLFYTLRSMGYAYRQRRIPKLLELWRGQKAWLESLEKERAELCRKHGITRKELFELSMQLYKKGIIKYLGFDKPERIDMLTEDYKRGMFKDHGIDLAISLIVEKYKKERLARKV